jgi:hypothetical protein
MIIFYYIWNSFFSKNFNKNIFFFRSRLKSINTQVRYISTNVSFNNNKLNPWWVTGFSDGEGSFSMSIFKSKTAAIGWTIEPCFIITLHKRDLELLNSIKNFFSVGSVSLTGNLARFRVRSRSDLQVIIAHFNKYPLQTTKLINFLYFCEILSFINKKFHTNIPGFLKLVSLINKLNNPLSESLLDKLVQLGPLPNVEFETNINLGTVNKIENLDPYWISGFVTGEGSFTYFTKTRKNSSGKIVKDYSLVIEVSQRTQDLHVLNLIALYFKVGKVYTETRGMSKYRLGVKSQILSTLVPHFNNYPLEGYKNLQYSLWLNIVNILNDQIRTEQRDIELENLIKELTDLKK